MKQKQFVGLIIFALGLGIFMENLDHTVMATAIPSVVADLGGMNQFTWVFSIYLLTSTIFIPVFAKLADMYGKKPFLLIGFATFVIASILSANASSMTELILFRGLQGMGAAPLMPIAFALIFEIVVPEKQGHMQGLFAIVNGASMIAGPLLGAFLVDHFTWHWIFLINIPLGVIAFLIIAFFYKETVTRQKGSVDYVGAALLVAALTPTMFALVTGGNKYAWTSITIHALFAIGLLFAILFIIAEKRALEPIISLHLFNRKMSSSTGISFLQGIVLVGVMTYIPLFIQGVIGGTATQVGNLITPLIIALMVGGAAGSHLMPKVATRSLVMASAVLMAVGAAILIPLNSTTSMWIVNVAMILIGMGLGPLMPLTTLLAQNSVSKEHTTSATSLITFFRNIGMAMGSSLLAVLINRSMSGAIDRAIPLVNQQQTRIIQDPNFLMNSAMQSGISANVVDILKSGLNLGISQVFIACVSIIAIMFLIGLMAGKDKLVSHTEGKKKLGFH